MRAFSLDHAWIQRVDADLFRAEFAGEHAGDGVNRALCASVNRTAWRCKAASDRTNIDNAATLAEVLHCGLRGENEAEHVNVENPVELVFGDRFDGANRRLRIVGIVENSTALANLPNIFLTTEGAQQLVYGGQPLVASIGIRGTLDQVPAGYKAIDRDGAIADLLRPLKVAVNSITIVAILLWVVAALIVGSVIYLSALERLRDFAVFKAIGVPTGSIAAGLALQAIVVALSAVVVGVVLSALLGPIFPMQVIVPSYAYVILPVIAVVFGLIASGTGLHRAVSVDPAMAFGGP